jgi:Uma2 family endonuclease
MDGLLYLLYKEGKGIKSAQVPDVSFIRGVDIITAWRMEQPYPGAPTLAVEVMSPDDKIEEVLLRVRRYLNAGSERLAEGYRG